MARETHADETRHARPHGRVARAHAELKWRNMARTRVRGHASPRERPGDAMWQGAGV